MHIPKYNKARNAGRWASTEQAGTLSYLTASKAWRGRCQCSYKSITITLLRPCNSVVDVGSRGSRTFLARGNSIVYLTYSKRGWKYTEHKPGRRWPITVLQKTNPTLSCNVCRGLIGKFNSLEIKGISKPIRRERKRGAEATTKRPTKRRAGTASRGNTKSNKRGR